MGVDPRINFNTDYQAVAASQSDAIIAGQKGVGAAGDILEAVVIVPTTTAAGDVSIKDGGGSSITIFKTGTLSDLKPFRVELGIRSVNGPWKLTTGANVSAIACGQFK